MSVSRKRKAQMWAEHQSNKRGMGLARDVRAGEAAETPLSLQRKARRRFNRRPYPYTPRKRDRA